LWKRRTIVKKGKRLDKRGFTLWLDNPPAKPLPVQLAEIRQGLGIRVWRQTPYATGLSTGGRSGNHRQWGYIEADISPLCFRFVF
jgi:hypothetical protein